MYHVCFDEKEVEIKESDEDYEDEVPDINIRVFIVMEYAENTLYEVIK